MSAGRPGGIRAAEINKRNQAIESLNRLNDDYDKKIASIKAEISIVDAEIDIFTAQIAEIQKKIDINVK